MNLATFVYRRLLRSKGIRKRFWKSARKKLIRLANDPACTFPLYGRQLSLPLSHALPLYLKAHEHYDQLPVRLSAFLHQERDSFKCIDVGANIGDSVAAFYGNDDDLFLAIEPNPHFYQYLTSNWESNKNIQTLRTICASGDENEAFVIQEKDGTASLVPSEEGATMTRQSLDSIVKDYPDFKEATLLKIDTDGHDFEVLVGANHLLATAQPAILFECDAFANERYVEDCLEALSSFLSTGYQSFLLYDNFGNLIGKFSLENLSPIKNLLSYQLTSPFYYFDILVMKEADLTKFHKKEVEFFVKNMSPPALRRTASAAAEV